MEQLCYARNTPVPTGRHKMRSHRHVFADGPRNGCGPRRHPPQLPLLGGSVPPYRIGKRPCPLPGRGAFVKGLRRERPLFGEERGRSLPSSALIAAGSVPPGVIHPGPMCRLGHRTPVVADARRQTPGMRRPHGGHPGMHSPEIIALLWLDPGYTRPWPTTTSALIPYRAPAR